MTHVKPQVYVLATEVHGRERLPVLPNVSYRILEENYHILPEEVRNKHDAYKAFESSATESLRLWAKEFLAALDRGGPYPTRRYTLVTEQDPEYSKIMRTLKFVWRQGRYGATVDEIRLATHLRGNGVSGYLSNMHKAGILERLKETR